MWRPGLLAMLVLPGAALAQGGAALLPIAGDAALVARVTSELPPALTRRRAAVHSPAQTRRLLRADPALTRTLAAAGQRLMRSDQALLRMQRTAAVSAARQAIVALETAGAEWHSRPELARAGEALARALLLRPADEGGAAAAVARAIAVDPAHRADVDRSPPRLRALLEQARQRAPSPVTPTAAALAPLAAAARVDRLIWLGVTRVSATELQLRLLVFSAPEGAIARRDHRLPEAELVDWAATQIAALLGVPAAAASRAVAPPRPAPAPSQPATALPPIDILPPPATALPPIDILPPPAARPTAAPPAPPAVTATPWYKRWWVWTIAGVVVAGTAVGLGVGLKPRHSPWDISFSF